MEFRDKVIDTNGTSLHHSWPALSPMSPPFLNQCLSESGWIPTIWYSTEVAPHPLIRHINPNCHVSLSGENFLYPYQLMFVSITCVNYVAYICNKQTWLEK
ncbi:hypothetical protein JTE90_003970 [Oedothorax gibbosus]|uniref:Uncharacterized protein n=1 Tax=Oedothorax gibbosus TaxID=931172 RepID=A0AAV6UX18_9ARAC|nr:hypothetical protein JTE90_003970 [Oedothorax gibbosus]